MATRLTPSAPTPKRRLSIGGGSSWASTMYCPCANQPVSTTVTAATRATASGTGAASIQPAMAKQRNEDHSASLWAIIRRRSAAEIEAARSVDLAALPDPEADDKRVQKPQWLVVVGICTHLGCIPKGQRTGERRGEYEGWFCPCHGSHYDTSGRIRKGPAPTNLPVPKYQYLSDTVIRIG